MTATKFYKLYNRLLSEATNTEEVIDGFTHHLHDLIPDLSYICGYTVETGCLIRKDYIGPQAAGCPIIPLTVTDVHRHLFSLEDHYITHVDQLYGLPYIDADDRFDLSASLSNYYGADSDLVHLSFFCDGLLKAVLFIVFPLSISPSEDLISELLFCRDTLEALVYKVMRKRDAQAFDHLLGMGMKTIKYSQENAPLGLAKLLNLALDLSGEGDFGSCIYLKDGYWRFAHTVGHNMDALKDIHLPAEMYLTHVKQWEGRKEVAPNIFIVPNILNPNTSGFIDTKLEALETVTDVSKPIKETLQLQISFNHTMKAVISLDIGEGSPKSFTNQSIQALRRIDFLAQLLYTNVSLKTKTTSLEKLIDLIAKMIGGKYDDQNDFLNAYLNLLVDSLEEAAYATAYTRDEEGIHFLAAIGHSLDGLKKTNLKPEHFVSVETIDAHKMPFVDTDGNAMPVSATLMSDILSFAKNSMPDDVYEAYTKATLPIKDAIISQAPLDDQSYMYISCDIKAGSPMTFSKESMQLFSALNNLGFSAISTGKLEATARTDSMTGLLNHKHVIDLLDQMTNNKAQLSIFLFDVDYFKRVNDTFGHQVGDEVLINISQSIQEDKKITAGRYGGEEFLILMPDFSYEEALDYCSDLLVRIEQMPLLPDQAVTISGGLVTRVKGSATELIRSADTLLYLAKNSGRNRLESGYC